MASPGESAGDSTGALVPRSSRSLDPSTPDTSSTAAPALRPSVAVAKLMKQAPLRIGTMTFDTTQAVIEHINSFPMEKRYDLQKTVLHHLIDYNEKFDDMLVNLYNEFDSSKAYQHAKVTRHQYTTDLDEVIIRVRHVNERRDRRQEAVRSIKKLLEGSQRGELLYVYFLDRDAIKGKNVFITLSAFFKRVKPVDAVARLNQEIIRHAKRKANPTQGDHGDILGLRSTDCENAWTNYKAEEAAGQLATWVRPVYTHEELQALGLGWDACGILEAGVFFRHTEPLFEDEDIMVPPPPPGPRSPLDQVTEDEEIYYYVEAPPVTPVRKRKRAADRSYTPAKQRKVSLVEGLVSGRSSRPRTGQCDCDMPAEWKNTVVRALDREHLSFPDERELIRPLVENESANGDPIPCLYHLRALADRLHMVSDLDTATLADHFSIVWNESTKETDWIRLISHKDTRDLFKNNATFEGIRSRVSLNTMRFAPLLSQAQTYDMAAVIARIGPGVHFLQGPAGSLREQLDSFSTSDCITAVGSYDWLFDKKKGVSRDILAHEVQMYVHHLRQEHRNRRDGLLRNMYYGVIQQVIRQDPMLWLANVLLRDDSKYQLVSYPQCARLFPKEIPVSYSCYQGDTEDIKAGTSFAIRDEIVLSTGPRARIGVSVMTESASVVRSWLESTREKKLSLSLDEGAEVDAFRTFTTNAHLSWNPRDLRDGSVLFCKSGTPIKFEWQADSDNRLSFSSQLIAVDRDEKGELVTETGVSWDEIVFMHKNMKPPAVTRFEETTDITPFPFPGAVEVTGLGNISDALVGRLAWDSPVVQEEAKFWLTANWQEVNNSYSSFKVKALTTIKRCWGWVQSQERKNFDPSKSFFALSASDALNDPLSDDDEILEISEKEFEQAGASKPTGTPRRRLAKELVSDSIDEDVNMDLTRLITQAEEVSRSGAERDVPSPTPLDLGGE